MSFFSMNVISCFVSFTILLFFFQRASSDGGVDLIHETCTTATQSHNPQLDNNLCETSLRAAPGSNTTNLQELGVISVKLTLDNATYIYSYIDDLLKDGKTQQDPTVRKPLQDCLGMYQEAIAYVQQAIGDVKSSDFANAIRVLSTSVYLSTYCEDGFNKKSRDLIVKQSYNFYQLASISVQITKNLN